MGKANLRGRVFQRIYRDRKGTLQKTSTWSLKYQVAGKPMIISTGTQDYEEAVLMLRRKMAKAAQLGCSDTGVSVDQVLDLVIEDHRSKRLHTTYDVEHRVAKHLRPFFGTKKPFEITATLVERYVASRASNAEPATVNKELAYLRRAFRLGYRHQPQFVETVPVIRMLPICNSPSSKHNGIILDRRNHQLLRRLEEHLKAEDEQPLESDTVLDKNGEFQ
ncbi:MAG TPA: hypothetical protein VGL97_07420 [Bryobacteraceae bacterium]|jgi:hypothetical protein